MEVGAEQEKFGLEKSKADDVAVAKVYAKAGIKVFDLDEAQVDKWKARGARHLLEGLRRASRAARKLPTFAEAVASSSSGRVERLSTALEQGASSFLVGDRPRLVALLRARPTRVAARAISRRSRPTGRMSSRSSCWSASPSCAARLGAVAARPCRHRGRGDPAAAALDRWRLRLVDVAERSCSAPSSPGSPGRCCTKPGSKACLPRRRGRRRCGSPICRWRSACRCSSLQILRAASFAGHEHPRRSACSYRRRHAVAMFSGMPIAFALGLVATVLHDRASCRRRRSIR